MGVAGAMVAGAFEGVLVEVEVALFLRFVGFGAGVRFTVEVEEEHGVLATAGALGAGVR